MKYQKYRFFIIISLILLVGCSQQTQVNFSQDFPESPTLTVEEYKLVSAEEDSPSHFEFTQYLSEEAQFTRSAWKHLNPDQMTASTNEKLAKHGYVLKQNPIMSSFDFQLFKGETVLLDHIYQFSPISYDESKENFVISFVTKEEKSYYLVKNGLYPVENKSWFRKGPVYAGNSLTYADLNDNGVYVEQNGEIIFSKAVEFTVKNPFEYFLGWENNWVLEVDDTVYINEVNLNRLENKKEIFFWHLIQDLPFYFYRDKSGKLPYSFQYAGQDYPAYRYEEIVHGNCCEPAIYNPNGNEYMVWFYALRDGYWYLVEVGVYP